MLNKRNCFFLDRKGIINKNYCHIINKKKIKLLKKVLEAINYLNSKNFIEIIVTNQSVVVKGLIKGKDLNKIYNYTINLIKKRCGKITNIFYCPFHPKFEIGRLK